MSRTKALSVAFAVVLGLAGLLSIPSCSKDEPAVAPEQAQKAGSQEAGKPGEVPAPTVTTMPEPSDKPGDGGQPVAKPGDEAQAPPEVANQPSNEKDQIQPQRPPESDGAEREEAKPVEMEKKEVAAAPMAESAAEGMADMMMAKQDIGGALRGAGTGMGGGGVGSATATLGRRLGSDGKDKNKGGNQEPAKAWGHSAAAPNTARLTVGDNEELPLTGSQFQVSVDGFRARVLVDYYFHNVHPRQLEGNFQLRLPNEASPYFLAFGSEIVQERVKDQPVPRLALGDEVANRPLGATEIMKVREKSWNAPKEARMVPREKAAFAYAETVRRRVDPALMEWSGADVFSSRVFPISASGLVHIVVGYDVDLLKLGADLEYKLDLPRNSVRNAVTVAIAGSDRGAVVTPDLAPRKEPGRAIYHWENPLERAVTLRIPNAGHHLLVGKDEQTGDFFATKVEPQLPQGAAPSSEVAVFAVDVSLSSNPAGMNVWLGLVKSILENNRGDIKQFAVLFFNIETFWWQEKLVDNTPEAVAELQEYMKTLALEGATDLASALAEAGNPPWSRLQGFDLFLLSDGSPTWGERELLNITHEVKKSRARSLFAYRTGLSGTDTRMLDALARAGGGAVFSVVSEADIGKASTAHRSRPWRIMGMTVDGATDLLIAGRPTSIFPGQSLLLVGRGRPGSGASLNLKLQQGEGVVDVAVPLGQTLDSPLAPRLYGQVAVGTLEEFSEATRKESEAYARHFRITGQSCSLLMLESEADYLRFNIKPEEDVFVVKSLAASALVEKVMKQLGDALGDGKARLVAWVKRLPDVPGLGVSLSTALNIYLDGLPSAAFTIRGSALKCAGHTWSSVPGLVREHLASRELAYDEMNVDAEQRLTKLGPADALKTLSSMVENRPGDTNLARDVAFSALSFGLAHSAYHLLYAVVQSRPHEPQNYLAIAQVLASMGNYDLATVWYELALSSNWDSRFGEFRKIVLVDYIRFLRKATSEAASLTSPDFLKARLDTLKAEFDLKEADLLVVITWNTDNTDVDLHVKEPSGETCYYGNRRTRLGGEITTDVTQGYGPEMYVMKTAAKGTYDIFANYYASDSNRATTRTKVFATIIQNWGKPNETETRKSVPLTYGSTSHPLVNLTVK